MDKNTITGFLLIFLLLVGYNYFMSPSEAELAAHEAMLDSLRLVEAKRADSLTQKGSAENYNPDSSSFSKPDSLRKIQLAGQYGPFQNAAVGTESFEVLENDVFKILFTNKGGKIKEVLLKKYYKTKLDTATLEDRKLPLKLLEDEKNRFEYLLPVNGIASGLVSSNDLFFTTMKGDNSLTFRAETPTGQFFEQKYSISDGYTIEYDLKFSGMGSLFRRDAETVKLNWITFLDKIEQNTQYDGMNSTVYFKESADDPDYCSCTSDDTEDFEGKRIDWVAHSNQFFESALISKNESFEGGVFKTKAVDPEDEDLKKVQSVIYLPYGENESFSMDFYVGPKKFETLKAFGKELEYTIPFGSSIFGTINRWVIRPLFNFLSGFIGSHGIVILVLTFIVKMLLYPLTYKMVHSQSKMSALKPQLASLKEKHKDDAQKVQMETMKMYQEFGVNPLGGCLPVVAQMPIWFALYRFFPASIEFRQASFLWANDLSSYDIAFWLPWDIPFYGHHVSLFTLLWAATTVLYTVYNMRHMDMTGGMGGANMKMMKYMQYGMPVMFLFFFNGFAAGLTCYLLFSNLMNVGQMVITKEFLIDHDKIKARLEENRKKPKKKGGFRARLEEAMKEQQRMQAERDKQKSKRNKSRKR